MADNKPDSGAKYVILVDLVGNGLLKDMQRFTHETSGSFEESSDVVEVTTKFDGGQKFAEVSAIGWTLSADGVLSFFDNAFERLKLRFRAKTKIYVAFLDESGAMAEFGQGVISSITRTTPVDGSATFSISVVGSGAITQVSA